MRIIIIIALLAFLQAPARAEITLEEAKTNGMQETLQTYIEQNAIIADICVYEQTWIPATGKVLPSGKDSQGKLIQRAVITHVHCGAAKVGDRIEYIHYIEEPPRLFKQFTSTVAGELRTFFYSPDKEHKLVEGILKIQGAHWGFDRVGDVFAELFALELKTNPKLKPKSEQGGAVTPEKK